MIQLEHLYKLWGPNPATGVKLLQQGHTKASLLAEHRTVVGLNDINLQIAPGELFVIMGLSGSGKSTLLRLINRLVEPTAGRVSIDGEDITALDRAALRRVRSRRLAMVFQHFALLPHRTVLENVVFGLEVQGVPEQQRNATGAEALRAVGLEGWSKYLPDQLSGGMQQRVGLARALATNSDILLMDEAFSALDPLIRQQMQRELVRLQKQLKKTVIFVTHDLDEALFIGDRIAILRAGEILQLGTPEDIVLHPADDHVATFVQNVNLLNVLTAARISNPISALEQAGSPASADYRWLRAGNGEVVLLDDQQRPLGVVDEQSARSAEWDPARLQLREVATVDETTILRDLLRSGPNAIPAVVLDLSGKACGIIRARGVINAFTEWDEQTAAIIRAGEKSVAVQLEAGQAEPQTQAEQALLQAEEESTTHD